MTFGGLDLGWGGGSQSLMSKSANRRQIRPRCISVGLQQGEKWTGPEWNEEGRDLGIRRVAALTSFPHTPCWPGKDLRGGEHPRSITESKIPEGWELSDLWLCSPTHQQIDRGEQKLYLLEEFEQNLFSNHWPLNNADPGQHEEKQYKI